jgi:peptidoglycan/LPS O-acetylase OafA/YrhL
VVVLYHFGVPPFSGGFVGVDIFFVISGLLMTQIIDRGIASGRFTVLGFYAARVRRIVPALAVLCLTLLAFGAVAIDPMTYTQLGWGALSALLFGSNFLFATQGGYFAQGATINWLLHTWTLSVEWQFYLVYPLVLWLLAKFDLLWRHRARLIGIGCVIGFIGMVVVAGHSSALERWSFYLLPTRAWEMLAGGWLALAPPTGWGRTARRIALAIGAALILTAVFLLDWAFPWPSIWTALPVLGTAAILAANKQDSIWLRVPGVQTLGVWSYSIYLWHWPIVVGLAYFGFTGSIPATLAGLALTLVLGGLSHALVETRLRKALFGPGGQSSRTRWLTLAAGAVALLALPVGVARTRGLEKIRTASLSVETRARLADYRAADSDWTGRAGCDRDSLFDSGRICVIGAGHPDRIAIIGDSHAEQMIPRFAAIVPSSRTEITMFRREGCPPLSRLNWTGQGRQCSDFATAAFDRITRERFPKVIVLVGWWVYFGHSNGALSNAMCRETWIGCRPIARPEALRGEMNAAFDDFTRRIGALTHAGIDVTLVLPSPAPGTYQPLHYYRQTLLARQPVLAPPIDRAGFLADTQWVRSRLTASARATGARLVDPLDTLCPQAACPVFDGSRYLYKDTHHFRSSVVTRPQFGYLDSLVVDRR